MSGIFDPAIFDSKIFDEGATSGAGSGAGSHRLGRRPKKNKSKGFLEKIEAGQLNESLPISNRPVEPPAEARLDPAPAHEESGRAQAEPVRVAKAEEPRLDGIKAKLDRIEGTLRLNAEKARISKENARVEAARVAKQIEDEEDEFMLLVA